ncbi:MAG: hypothetical protein F4X11_21880 [Acidobacteria bacterium]|nr:hypothetical protein [Acidobacteriota bacterium]
MATTAAVEQGGARISIAKEAIESFVDQVNGERALALVVEHDPLCMPVGKTKEAWTEAVGGEYAAMARIHIEDGARGMTHVKSGAKLVCLSFAEAPKPFVNEVKQGEHNSVAIRVDRANFESPKSRDDFMEAVKRIDDGIVREEMGRRSIVPEPLIQFVVSNVNLGVALAVGLWMFKRAEKFVRYTIDETLRKTADEISDTLSAKIKEVVRAYSSRQTTDDRAVLTEVVIPSNVTVILITKTNRCEEFSEIDLKNVVAEMEQYGDLLRQAQEVTFFRTGTNDWTLQHLKTRAGEVIGTLECYNRTMERLRLTREIADVAKRDNKHSDASTGSE